MFSLNLSRFLLRRIEGQVSDASYLKLTLRNPIDYTNASSNPG